MNLQDIKKLFTKEGLLRIYDQTTPSQRFVIGFMAVVLFLGLIRLVFDPGHQAYETVMAQEEVQEDSVQTSAVEPDALVQKVEDAEKAAGETPVEEKEEAEAPGEKKWPYYTKPIVRWTDKEFCDLNDVQLVAARKNGLKHRLANREEAEELVAKGGLVFVGASPLFCADDFKHSIPYLVPKAHRLLNRVAINFIDSLKSKGIPAHKIIVSSVLRTTADVSRLQRQNVNATTQSCHEYATTFDITYKRYDEMEEDPLKVHDMNREVKMKRALGEVLRDLRYEGRCYVKHEVKESCFHVTVR